MPKSRELKGGEEYTNAQLVGLYSLVIRTGGIEYPSAVMLLKGEGWGDYVLPIYIGRPEAEAIARALYNVATQRPMTHDLIISILDTLDVKVEKVTIDALLNNVYTATIVLCQEVNGKIKRYYVDARPSDSVAIAVRANAPILINEKLRKYAVNEEDLKERLGSP
ncbi:MAG: bifunctional nuclease family protein [Thermoprotei archaeon]|nr:MAG: bifunctional nuclease family protein [Thermoprotei archaeon]RLE98612.1 MAG: bifunctional nuclease family protein [Thermoprotei archaeon]